MTLIFKKNIVVFRASQMLGWLVKITVICEWFFLSCQCLVLHVLTHSGATSPIFTASPLHTLLDPSHASLKPTFTLPIPCHVSLAPLESPHTFLQPVLSCMWPACNLPGAYNFLPASRLTWLLEAGRNLPQLTLWNSANNGNRDFRDCHH